MREEEIVDIISVDQDETYDLEVDHPDHTFYANDISVSNSHAISYSVTSFQTAYLLYYHKAEWLCSFAQNQLQHPEERIRALSEIRTHGYTVLPVDINTSDKKWKPLENKQFAPSFLTIKGIGESAIDEILSNRPYKDIYDFLYNPDGSWRHSKVNKKTIEALIKTESFSSLGCVGEGKTFSSYRHMHHVIVENDKGIKKHLVKTPFAGRQKFEELTISSRGIPDWEPREKIEFRKDLLGYFDIGLVASEKLQLKLASLGISSLDDFPEDETKQIVWFVIDKVEKRISKNNKSYFLFSALGSSGKTNKVYCWGTANNEPPPEYSVIVCEITKSAFGFTTTFFKVKKL